MFTQMIDKALSAYSTSDYITHKRAQFLFYSTLAAIVASVVLSITTAYLHLLNPNFDSIHLPTLLPIIALFVFFCVSLFFLIKGKLELSGNMLFLFTILGVWLVMYFDKSKDVGKIDTIVFIFTALALLPIVCRSRRVILIHSALNFGIFIIFLIYLYQNLDLHEISLLGFRDVVIDLTVAFIFLLIVQYNVFAINYVALKNAKDEIQVRKQVSTELQHHKDNLQILVEEKTLELESTNQALRNINLELQEKNDIINLQNNELKETLGNLREAQTQLIQAEKMASLGTLTAGVAHEINNPLNFIMGSYSALKEILADKADEKEGVGKLLNTLKTGVDRASNIVKGLNQFSRSQENFNETCDIHLILENCLLMVNNQVKYRIEVQKNYVKEKIECKGNVGKMHQIFINLLTNAIQAIETTGTISITTRRLKNIVSIEISDNGCGISKKNLTKILDPFFTTKDPGKGTGLGLSITYNIVKEHKGKLDFSSEVGKGTKAVVELPIA